MRFTDFWKSSKTPTIEKQGDTWLKAGDYIVKVVETAPEVWIVFVTDTKHTEVEDCGQYNSKERAMNAAQAIRSTYEQKSTKSFKDPAAPGLEKSATHRINSALARLEKTEHEYHVVASEKDWIVENEEGKVMGTFGSESEAKTKIKELTSQSTAEKMGVEAAGPVPGSLLARQDLEGSETTKRRISPSELKQLQDKQGVMNPQFNDVSYKNEYITVVMSDTSNNEVFYYFNGTKFNELDQAKRAIDEQKKLSKSQKHFKFSDFWKATNDLSESDKEKFAYELLQQLSDASGSSWVSQATSYLRGKGVKSDDISDIIEMIKEDIDRHI